MLGKVNASEIVMRLCEFWFERKRRAALSLRRVSLSVFEQRRRQIIVGHRRFRLPLDLVAQYLARLSRLSDA